jgi:putative transposase
MTDLMGRYRKIHIQQSLLNLAGTKVRDPRGGTRKGAGRPPTAGRRRTPHRRRAAFRASQPVHVSIKFLDTVVKTVDGFRKMDLYKALRRALVTTGRREDMRIVHVSIQDSHLHLIVEADGKTALARGIQGFKISAAKWINRAIWERGGRKGPLRKGAVFAERYFSEVIRSPRQARNALSYVLNNWRRHRLDQGELAHKLIDKFSTALMFDGWRDFDRREWSIPRDYESLVVWEPRTWLLREGWRRHGLISVYERPAHALHSSVARRLARESR